MSEKENEKEEKKGVIKRIRTKIAGCVVASLFIAILILMF